MYIKINSDSGVAPYLQIVKQIKYLVACGSLSRRPVTSCQRFSYATSYKSQYCSRAYRELRYEKILKH